MLANFSIEKKGVCVPFVLRWVKLVPRPNRPRSPFSPVNFLLLPSNSQYLRISSIHNRTRSGGLDKSRLTHYDYVLLPMNRVCNLWLTEEIRCCFFVVFRFALKLRSLLMQKSWREAKVEDFERSKGFAEITIALTFRVHAVQANVNNSMPYLCYQMDPNCTVMDKN